MQWKWGFIQGVVVVTAGGGARSRAPARGYSPTAHIVVAFEEFDAVVQLLCYHLGDVCRVGLFSLGA